MGDETVFADEYGEAVLFQVCLLWDFLDSVGRPRPPDLFEPHVGGWTAPVPADDHRGPGPRCRAFGGLFDAVRSVWMEEVPSYLSPGCLDLESHSEIAGWRDGMRMRSNEWVLVWSWACDPEGIA
jgi:hypothetical protein